ncbi:DnaB helicase C-terminal domain-containing protein [Morganella morganii]
MIVRTGIEAIDNKIGGFNPTDLIFIGGRPGMGKTELALTMMEGMTAKGDGVLMFSMEMANMQIVERMISGAARLPASKLRNCDLDDEEWQRVIASTGYLQDRDIHIIDASNLTIDQICAISERHKRKYPATKGIFIDYLGLIKKPKAERNDLAIAAISAGMKGLAKHIHTPVVALSQLSRDVDKRPLNQRRPVAADLRDSGSLEQDADYIFLTYRDVVYNPNSPAKNYAEIIIEKNRHGETGTVYQEFKNGHYLPTDQISAAEVSRMQQQAEVPKRRRYADKAF